MKHVLLVCGTGIATSTVVRKKVEEALNARGYKGKFTVDQGKVAEVGGLSPRYDLVVSTVRFDPSMSACPVIQGTQFLMGFGTEPIVDKIEKSLFGSEAK
jgi:PTS system galactitol-specific IIB component